MTDARPPARALAHRHTPGAAPTIVFLPGYASDMTGSKATALEAWAVANDRAFLRFDYAGCGASDGAFEDQTLAGWLGDVEAMLDTLAAGPAVLVGSSMGGWLMLLAARRRPGQVVGLVGIAPAPDFTDWGFTTDEKLALVQTGRIERRNPYGPAPTVYTRSFWASAEANRLMFGTIAIDCPVRLVHGQADPDVPWQRTVQLAGHLRSADVQTWLIKDGEHRLSRDGDIALIVRAVEDVVGKT